MYSQDLPIQSVVQELRSQWDQSQFFVVEAPPGAGKSTVLALDLLTCVAEGMQIWQTQPRRVAALGVALRMADCMGEDVGQTVGYKVKMESAVSSKTRIHVVTEGVLGRVLRDDPELAQIGAVLLDEFHERSLQCDLNLALLLEIQAALRPDLKIIVLSATPDPKWAKAWPSARMIRSEGRSFPVDVKHLQYKSENRDREMLQILASLPVEGSSLVFFPGQREIFRFKECLEKDSRLGDRLVRTLYGQMPLAEQKQVLQESCDGRIVLATNIAETSLTLRDVVYVLDSGEERFALHEPQTGLSRLETRRISLASASQRSGRAGRVRPGVAYRLWTLAEESYMRPAQVAEILDGDLSSLVLELAAWNYSPEDLTWVDAPPQGAWRSAQRRLEDAGLLVKGKLSPRGKSALKWPFEPRLGLLVELAVEMGQKDLGLALAVLLSERDFMRSSSVDLWPRLAALLGDSKGLNLDQNLFKHALGVLKKLGFKSNSKPADWADLAQKLLLKTYPERVAGTRKLHAKEYLMAVGRAAELPDQDSLKSEPFLLVLDASYGQKTSQIRLALALDATLVEGESRQWVELEWDSQAEFWQGRQCKGFGAIVLESQVQKTFAKETLLPWIRENWLDLPIRQIPLLKMLEPDLDRLFFACPYLGLEAAEIEKNIKKVWFENLPTLWPAKIQAKDALISARELWQMVLGWELDQEWNRRFPQKWQSPAGHWIDVIYEDLPTLSAPLQDFYGVEVHPSLEGGTLAFKLSLLSPARRPLQLTKDLPGFWRGSYKEVQKEMKGRYPRHNWPDEPWAALAGHRIKSRPPQA